MPPKTAIVTGSTSGIGLAISDALAREGYRVVLTGRRKSLLEELVASRKSSGLLVEALPADLEEPQGPNILFDQAMERLGGRLDLLVNNAGSWHGAPVDQIDVLTFDRMMALNLRAPFLLSGRALSVMKQARSGTIVNISSVAGIEAWAGTSLYSATKFGLRALTQSLLEEGAPFGIKSFAICPGYVHTPMTESATVPPEEMIQPEDIARLVLMHLSLSGSVVLKDVIVSRLGS